MPNRDERGPKGRGKLDGSGKGKGQSKNRPLGKKTGGKKGKSQ